MRRSAEHLRKASAAAPSISLVYSSSVVEDWERDRGYCKPRSGEPGNEANRCHKIRGDPWATNLFLVPHLRTGKHLRTRNYIKKFYLMKANVQAISLKLQVASTTQLYLMAISLKLQVMNQLGYSDS